MKKIIVTGLLVVSVAISGYLVNTHNTAEFNRKLEPVQNFDIDRYLGKWYEMARIDFRFQKDLVSCTALYTLNDNGTIGVLNSGYDTKKNKWRKAEGKAKFRSENDVAALKVSFFGPFYSDYNVIALDKNYTYALIAGRNLDYLWILSRTKDIPDDVKNNYLKIAQSIGYDTSRLLWDDQSKNGNPYTGK
jgi:apolipoprotein D and lipocalin family protein